MYFLQASARVPAHLSLASWPEALLQRIALQCLQLLWHVDKLAFWLVSALPALPALWWQISEAACWSFRLHGMNCNGLLCFAWKISQDSHCFPRFEWAEITCSWASWHVSHNKCSRGICHVQLHTMNHTNRLFDCSSFWDSFAAYPDHVEWFIVALYVSLKYMFLLCGWHRSSI